VFQRLIRDDHQPPSGPYQFAALVQTISKRFHFFIDHNSQCLKHLGEISVFLSLRSQLLQRILEITSTREVLLYPRLNNRIRRTPGIPYFTVHPQDAVKLFRAVLVQNLCRRKRLASVHPHVKRTIEACREASFCEIYLMRRDPEVSEDAIHLCNSIQLQVPFHVSEVGLTECKRTICNPLSFFHCFFILIKSNESASLQLPENRLTVPSPTKSCVHISSFRVYCQRGNAFG